ncbi:MAG: cytochrome C peroxidase [Bacteroidetes bacterium]|nr:cytochrome C peroxidase [Bacteroidota bacterium]
MRPILSLLLISLFILPGCEETPVVMDDDNPVMGDLEHIAYEPMPYDLQIPDFFPEMIIPEENPLTVDGVELGRFLFYDPILSLDSTQSCASCHLVEGAFTDNLAVSFGVQGLPGKRSSMSLLNVGYYYNGLFWDGRSPNLEEQALHPIEDPLEMDNTWEVVIDRLQNHEIYPEMFRKAFGIKDREDIDRDLATKAIASFERTLISGGNSKYDRKFLAQEPGVPFTVSEFRGRDMFFDESEEGLPDAQCFHCHGGVLLTVNDYRNNGLQEVDDLNDFEDFGLGAVTGKLIDNGKFRAPTLRNIALTAPYMHDGSIETLEEVIDFYNEGVHYADNLDENLVIQPLGLDEEMKADLLAFLHTLTDTTFLSNPAYQNPFEE